jgi:SAM-dependent methyltransferase/uncharacterized protein YbaR (Trm112 family)
VLAGVHEVALLQSSGSLDPRLLALLECPRDRSELHVAGRQLCCAHGHKYPIVDGVPTFLLAEKEQTIGIARESLKAAEDQVGGPLYLDTLGLSKEEKTGIGRNWNEGRTVDAVISYLVGATSGWGYVNRVGRLESYPIPDIPLGNGNGQTLLDLGCNWGRWSVSAARKGWRVIGIDPSLGAILAAKRAFSAWDLDMAFVCGDARFMPFKSGVVQCAFSYSVIQHFSETDAGLALSEVGRILGRDGFAKIQMANKGGLRSTYIRTRREYLDGGPFRVRYWSISSLREEFSKRIGPAQVHAEAFGGLGLLYEDWDFVSGKAKLLVSLSTLLKRLSSFVHPLVFLADSVYVVSAKN